LLRVAIALIVSGFAVGLYASGDVVPALGLAAWVTWVIGSLAIMRD
jgi:hypothetical protein